MVKIDVPMDERPECIVEGCCNKGQMLGRNKEGYPYFRKYCGNHYYKMLAADHGVPNIKHVLAANAGFSSVSSYLNSMHRYRKYRLSYCENQDGRLGFICTSNIIDDCMLDTDHIDGNNNNNDPNNLQTLCKCCHAYKTLINEDHKNRYAEVA